MTRSKPLLIINELYVVDNKHVLYREKFHKGVNIIRSTVNSVGKSTIVDFIFFCLGGEVANWINEIKGQEEVYLEVKINNNIWTLKRVLPKGDSPIYMIEGGLNSALKASVGWSKYPYKRSKNQESFSQVIFNLLGFPEQKTENDDNITINQLLRLVYEDQITPVNKIFRQVEYDKEATRRAVYELLMGLDDFELHFLRTKNKNLEKELSEYKGELKIINELLSIGTSKAQEVRAMLLQKKSEIDEQIKKLQESINRQMSTVDGSEVDSEDFKKLMKDASIKRECILQISSKISGYELEQEDSKEFIKSLNDRIKALSDSKLLLEHLGKMTFKYCPACLGEIKETANQLDCRLCKTPMDKNNSLENRLRMEQELKFQIKESTFLQEHREKQITTLMQEKKIHDEELRLLESKLKNLNDSKNVFDADLRNKIHQVGYLEREVLLLEEKIDKFLKLAEINSKIIELESSIAKNEVNIKKLIEESFARQSELEKFIKEKSLEIIKKDLPVEEGFQEAEEIIIDFIKDRIFVDGKVRFSASSLVILKNAVMLSLFLASTKYDYVRLPRFMILDNIEDKGMTPERSKNFQLIIASICEKIEEDFQVIFTTSMVEESLNIPSLTVGVQYTTDNKAIKIHK